MTKLKNGIFWGSFDPPHMGHIFAALQFALTTDLKAVWIIPVYKHPFGKVLTPFKDRMSMCYSAFEGIPKCAVYNFDEENETHDCLGLLKTIHKKAELYGNSDSFEYVMLGGSDVSSNDAHYKDKDKEEILKLCTVARVPRVDYSKDKYAIPNYSSSEIRKLVKEGKSINGLVHRMSEKYIIDNKLYLK